MMMTRLERSSSDTGGGPCKGTGQKEQEASRVGLSTTHSKQHAIRCYVNQRLSPMRVVKEMAAFGMLDSPARQRWFVERCFEADFVSHSSERAYGDILYFKNLLYKLAKELSRDGRVMEDAVAAAMGQAIDLATGVERAGSSSGDWLHKSYFYGRKDDDSYAVMRIGSHVNMFAGSTVRGAVFPLSVVRRSSSFPLPLIPHHALLTIIGLAGLF